MELHCFQVNSEDEVSETQLPSLDIKVDLPPPSCDNNLSVKVFLSPFALKSIYFRLCQFSFSLLLSACFWGVDDWQLLYSGDTESNWTVLRLRVFEEYFGFLWCSAPHELSTAEGNIKSLVLIFFSFILDIAPSFVVCKNTIAQFDGILILFTFVHFQHCIFLEILARDMPLTCGF